MIQSKRDLIFNYLHSSPKEVEAILLEKKSYYKSFPKTKYDDDGNIRMKNGKKEVRHITHATGKLKILQKNLLKNVFNQIPLLGCIKGGVKGISSIANAREHQGKKYRFQTDIRNFFPSISANQSFEALKKKGFSKQTASLITQLVTYEEALTQGNPTSTFIANLVFENVDKQLLHLIYGHNITYTRWVDDLTFSSSHPLQFVVSDIIQIIFRNGFKPHRKKTECHNKRSKITGISVGNNSMRPKDSFLQVDETNLNENQIQGRKQYKERVLGITPAKK
ncbi:reverse transcriptase family protein [Aureispira anguillae]|uniref:RNA-directed DNA polymerase n=1 Tax=Aureispira anguillae TaxID=2864201 RepID=A0A915YM12_9BACT|nr:reverse transcriptase family protein [Aureispira anguillae]BDS15688.1 reverse transcriptase family protein [Aureispira anguillae]